MSNGKRCAIITGVGGQDGSYLADLLLSKDYVVLGMTRRNSTAATLHRIQHLLNHPSFHMYYGDVTDLSSILQMLQDATTRFRHEVVVSSETPIELYHLAAQSHVQVSFETPIYTTQTDAIGTLNVLEAVRRLQMTQSCRVYQASTSELYGSSLPPQNETTPFQPRSPYAISKLYGYWIIKEYREAFGMYAVNGILFNHESERRGEEFVSRKVTQAVAKYQRKYGFTPLRLGNLYAKRDWGYAPDYVYGMWQMLQQPTPNDYVLATGECHTVKDLITIAFSVIGVNIRWEGTGTEEKGYDASNNQLLIEIDPQYFRLTEVDHLQGDASFARSTIQWQCNTSFKAMVKRMVENDVAILS